MRPAKTPSGLRAKMVGVSDLSNGLAVHAARAVWEGASRKSRWRAVTALLLGRTPDDQADQQLAAAYSVIYRKSTPIVVALFALLAIASLGLAVWQDSLRLANYVWVLWFVAIVIRVATCAIFVTRTADFNADLVEAPQQTWVFSDRWKRFVRGQDLAPIIAIIVLAIMLAITVWNATSFLLIGLAVVFTIFLRLVLLERLSSGGIWWKKP